MRSDPSDKDPDFTMVQLIGWTTHPFRTDEYESLVRTLRRKGFITRDISEAGSSLVFEIGENDRVTEVDAS